MKIWCSIGTERFTLGNLFKERSGENMIIKGKKLFYLGALTVFLLAALSGCGQKEKEYKQAGLGGLVMLYDDSVWTSNEESATDSSLLFESGDNAVLGVSCSREGMYQHPLDMLQMTKQIYSTYPGYQELSEPKKIEVNDSSWYEWSCQYEENGQVMKSLQRFFAENYYAYTMVYVADNREFDKKQQEALKAMNSVVMTVPGNEESEEEAKKFLVGEWNMSGAGYLVIREDGTYTWYMDSDQKEDNMHTGTYGCDIENESLGFSKGEGIYLVLFPERLTMEGKEGVTANAKYDYGISLDQQSDGTYQMLNISTFSMYQLVKQ